MLLRNQGSMGAGVQEFSPSDCSGNAVETQVGTGFEEGQRMMWRAEKPHWPAALLF